MGNRQEIIHYDGDKTVTTTYNYDAANRLETRSYTGGVMNVYYSFDANGNMTAEEDEMSDGMRSFTWNRDDRMTQVSNEYAPGDPIVQYVYDAMGRRIMRKKGSEWRMFYYDGLSVAAEKKSTNSGGAWAWDALYTLAPGVIGHVLAQSQWSGAAWVNAYLHYDHIGNATIRSGPEIESSIHYYMQVDYLDQDAFGNPLEGPSAGLRLQTKELDADVGLHYFDNRWFNSNNGGFISKSPFNISIEHPYFYYNNNPLRYIDPTGSLGVEDVIGPPEPPSTWPKGSRKWCEFYCLARLTFVVDECSLVFMGAVAGCKKIPVVLAQLKCEFAASLAYLSCIGAAKKDFSTCLKNCPPPCKTNSSSGNNNPWWDDRSILTPN